MPNKHSVYKPALTNKEKKILTFSKDNWTQKCCVLP